jgi:hypothetical protein
MPLLFDVEPGYPAAVALARGGIYLGASMAPDDGRGEDLKEALGGAAHYRIFGSEADTWII